MKILFKVIFYISDYERVEILHIVFKSSTEDSFSERLNGTSSWKSNSLFIFATESKIAQSCIIFAAAAASASECISVESCIKEPSSLQKVSSAGQFNETIQLL